MIDNESRYQIFVRIKEKEALFDDIDRLDDLNIQLNIRRVPVTSSQSTNLYKCGSNPESPLDYLNEIRERKWELKPKDSQQIVFFPGGRPFVKSHDLAEDYILWCRKKGIIPLRSFSRRLHEYFPNSKGTQWIEGNSFKGFFLDILTTQDPIADRSQ